MSSRRPAVRSRAPAVRMRGTTVRRPTIAEPRPNPFGRVWQVLRSPAFWWWCLAKVTALAFLVVLVTLLYHLVTSPRFYISEVIVEGNDLLGPREVADAAALSGGHILWANRRQAVQRLRGLPAVADAEVHLALPNRAKVIVTEREPVAVWQVGNRGYLVDVEGRVIGLAGRETPPTVVREGRTGTLQLGERVPAGAVAAAAALAERLPEEWQPPTGVFDYSADVGVSIATRNGWRVRFGDTEALDEKVATFLALAQEIERIGATAQLVDVRFPGRPYYR